MSEICTMDCCKSCPRRAECPGCAETGGRPYGGDCIAARCVGEKGHETFLTLKKTLVEEINGLGIPDLHVDDLNLLPGYFVNLEYPLPNGQTVKLLSDGNIYLGNQIERPSNERCYGVVADAEYILVCEYGGGGSDPEIVLYKRRREA